MGKILALDTTVRLRGGEAVVVRVVAVKTTVECVVDGITNAELEGIEAKATRKSDKSLIMVDILCHRSLIEETCNERGMNTKSIF
jgi:hypothetical protein